tara:strand:- start:348 stop:545 length:198 start_codon:yes stop_codon:yes gene_type:complete
MNEEDTTQTQDTPEENGEAEANVEETSGGEQDVLQVPKELPANLPPMPSVHPKRFYGYTSRCGAR